jgi:glutamyl endopeptidase
MRTTSLVVVGVSLIAVVGCGSTDDDVAQRSAMLDSPAPSVVSIRGESMALVGPAPFVVAKGVPNDAGSVASSKRLSADELAEGLRGVRLVNGNEYRASRPNVALAKRILSGELDLSDQVTPPSQTEGVAPPEEREGRSVIGSDNRTYRSSNQSYPNRTFTFSDLGCSGTMIGPSTMVTAAHCVYNTDTNAWYKVPNGSGGTRWPRYSTGVDGRDANPTPDGWISCYDITVPGGWVDGNDVKYDYAVLDFSSRCGDRPGDISGWIGTTTGWNDTEGHLIAGYPQVAKGVTRYTGSSTPFSAAELWADAERTGVWLDPSYQLKYPIDTTGGQSGAGVYYIADSNGWYILDGIHKGNDGDSTYNRGRRFDSTVRSFVEQYSDFPNP